MASDSPEADPRGGGQGRSEGEEERLATRKAAFLEALWRTRNVVESAKAAGRSRAWPYRQRVQDAAFAAAWDEALEVRPEHVLELEAGAMEKAIHGWLEPKYYKGKVVGAVRRFSPDLMKFMLMAHLPDKYRPKIERLDDDEAEALFEMIQERRAEWRRATIVDPPPQLDDPSDNGHGDNGHGES